MRVMATKKVFADEEHWRKRLDPKRFEVLRNKATEPPYSGILLYNKDRGEYVCAGCGQKLFESGTKFDSCGWPSFYDAVKGGV